MPRAVGQTKPAGGCSRGAPIPGGGRETDSSTGGYYKMLEGCNDGSLGCYGSHTAGISYGLGLDNGQTYQRK